MYPNRFLPDSPAQKGDILGISEKVQEQHKKNYVLHGTLFILKHKSSQHGRQYA